MFIPSESTRDKGAVGPDPLLGLVYISSGAKPHPHPGEQQQILPPPACPASLGTKTHEKASTELFSWGVLADPGLALLGVGIVWCRGRRGEKIPSLAAATPACPGGAVRAGCRFWKLLVFSVALGCSQLLWALFCSQLLAGARPGQVSSGGWDPT